MDEDEGPSKQFTPVPPSLQVTTASKDIGNCVASVHGLTDQQEYDLLIGVWKEARVLAESVGTIPNRPRVTS